MSTCQEIHSGRVHTETQSSPKKVVAVLEGEYYENVNHPDEACKGCVFEEAFATSSISKVLDLFGELGDELILSRREITPGLEIAVIYNRHAGKRWPLVLKLMTFSEFLSTPHREVIVDMDLWPITVYTLFN